MNVSFEVSRETAEKLIRAASEAGQDVSSFLDELLEEGLRNGKGPRRGVAEILDPFRSEVEQAGVTDEQLDRLFDAARERVFEAQRGKRQ